MPHLGKRILMSKIIDILQLIITFIITLFQFLTSKMALIWGLTISLGYCIARVLYLDKKRAQAIKASEDLAQKAHSDLKNEASRLEDELNNRHRPPNN